MWNHPISSNIKSAILKSDRMNNSYFQQKWIVIRNSDERCLCIVFCCQFSVKKTWMTSLCVCWSVSNRRMPVQIESRIFFYEMSYFENSIYRRHIGRLNYTPPKTAYGHIVLATFRIEFKLLIPLEQLIRAGTYSFVRSDRSIRAFPMKSTTSN